MILDSIIIYRIGTYLEHTLENVKPNIGQECRIDCNHNIQTGIVEKSTLCVYFNSGNIHDQWMNGCRYGKVGQYLYEFHPLHPHKISLSHPLASFLLIILHRVETNRNRAWFLFMNTYCIEDTVHSSNLRSYAFLWLTRSWMKPRSCDIHSWNAW